MSTKLSKVKMSVKELIIENNYNSSTSFYSTNHIVNSDDRVIAFIILDSIFRHSDQRKTMYSLSSPAVNHYLLKYEDNLGDAELTTLAMKMSEKSLAEEWLSEEDEYWDTI